MEQKYTYQDMQEYAEICELSKKLLYPDRVTAARMCNPERETDISVLDRLMKDENPSVRAEVAKKGYKLTELANDDNILVKSGVIEGCDTSNPEHRAILDTYISKENQNATLLIDIAKKGYGLKELANNDNKCVRQQVKEYMKSNPDWEKVDMYGKASTDKPKDAVGRG